MVGFNSSARVIQFPSTTDEKVCYLPSAYSHHVSVVVGLLIRSLSKYQWNFSMNWNTTTICIMRQRRPRVAKGILREHNNPRAIRLPNFSVYSTPTVLKAAWCRPTEGPRPVGLSSNFRVIHYSGECAVCLAFSCVLQRQGNSDMEYE